MNLVAEEKKKRQAVTFIGLMFMIYHALLACNNVTIVLYGGYMLVAGLVICDKLFSKERLKVVFPTSCKFLYYFVVFCYFSQIWAMNPQIVKSESFFLIAIAIYVVIMINYFVKIQNTEAIILAIAVAGMALAGYVIFKSGGIVQFYKLATTSGQRLGGEITNVNNIGMFGAISVIVLFYYGFFKKKMMCYPLAVLPFVASAASGSRKSILILASGIFFLVILSQRKEKGIVKGIKLIFLITIAVFAVQAVFSLEIMSTIRERMDSVLSMFSGQGRIDKSAEIRRKMIELGLESFKENPYLGKGLANSYQFNYQTLGIWTYSHNDYIELLINGGIVGFLLYYGNIFYLAVRHVKLMKEFDNPEIIISFVILILYSIMGVACVTYYNSTETYLYFILWISTVEIFERKHKLKKMAEAEREEVAK